MTPQTKQEAYVNTREDAPLWFLGLPTLIRSTGGAFALVEHLTMPPGFETPYHVHRREDEAFYILEGNVAFVADGQWIDTTAGAYVFGPRDVPHGFRVQGDTPAKMLILAAPAGFEKFVVEMSTDAPVQGPPDMAKLMALTAQYGIDILGPLPERAAS